jgi:hypothetical protein
MTATHDNGSRTGASEARRYLRTVRSDPDQRLAYEWLNAVIAAGRCALQQEGVDQADIEHWDNSCRVMFLLMTVERRNFGKL